MTKSKSRRSLSKLAAFALLGSMAFSIASCSGTPGATGPQGPQGPQGAQGAAGENGSTPFIGENGNWWIGDTDTGVSASGASSTVPEEVRVLQEYYMQIKSNVTGNDGKGYYYTDYPTLKEAYAASLKTVKQIAAEGYVLLKNENNALPLSDSEKHVSLLGVASVYSQWGGGGSGSGYPNSYGINSTSMKEGMENGGLIVNPRLNQFYKANYKQADLEPGPNVLSKVESSFANYNDAAILTIKRTGSEGGDLKMSNVDGHSNSSEHYLQLDDNEKALIRYAKKHFSKVIVLLNTSNIMEVGELNAKKTIDNLGVDAIMQIGHIGNNGLDPIGEILTGKISPSGHTTDTWGYDFTKDPSYRNIGDMKQNGPDFTNSYYLENNGTLSPNTSTHSVEYREDIYMGYKYYETAWYELNQAQKGTGDSWYDSTVLYPFGYGLSYTSFKWELYGAAKNNSVIDKANQTITLQVKVTNTGKVSGKDVVQVYATAPYTPYGIEKAYVNLMGFAKTKSLAPGESDVVSIQFVAQDMASFDWNDANGNDHIGYELEKGDYKISVMNNSHQEAFSVNRKIEKDILIDTDYTTGEKIQPYFSQTEGAYSAYNTVNDSLRNHLLSRTSLGNTDTLLPAASTAEDRTVTQDFIDSTPRRLETHKYAYQDTSDDYWYVNQDAIPSSWTQSDAEVDFIAPTDNASLPYRGYRFIAKRKDGSKAKIQLKDMAGVNYTDYKVVDGKIVLGNDEGSKKWDEFLNQLTWEEMIQIVNNGGYCRPEVASIGKEHETDPDGPTQLSTAIMFINNGEGKRRADGQLGASTLWPTGYLQGCTWNTGLLGEFGRNMGNEALMLHANGWYGPAANLHRSPFSGRNFEYFSEDGVLSGKMAAAIIRGATDKGIVCYMKHYALNEMETNRGGLHTWVTEQAMREIYLKGFEMAVKDGGCMGMMNSMNSIGAVAGYTNGALHDGLLRNEWGFKGITLTDAWMGNTYVNTQLRNGVDLPLAWAVAYGGQTGEMGIEVSRYDKESNMVYVSPEGIKGGEWLNPNIEDSACNYFKEQLTMASATEYYVVRRAAMHMLWTSANSSGNFNGFTNASDTVNVTSGAAVDTLILKDWTLSDVSLAEGSVLPNGLRLDENGRLTGTTTETGTFSVTIECLADGWIGNTNTFEYNGKEYSWGKRATATLTIVVA